VAFCERRHAAAVQRLVKNGISLHWRCGHRAARLNLVYAPHDGEKNVPSSLLLCGEGKGLAWQEEA